MRVSLRSMVIGVFTSLVLAYCAQSILAIATAVRSAQQVTSLYQHGLVPVVGSSFLVENLGQEQALLANDIASMVPERVEALYDELAGLDTSLMSAAHRVLAPASLARWQASWTRYLTVRAAYLAAVRRAAPAWSSALLHDRLANRLNAALDVVRQNAGVHLYTGEQLYTTALDNAWQAIRFAIVSLFIVLLLGACLAVLVTWRLTRGLGNLVATAQAITQGHAAVRADERGRDEIALVAAAFNVMIDAVLAAERRRIARDLHDSVLQDLIFSLQMLQLTQLQARDTALDVAMDHEITTLREAVHGMRTAVYDLRSEGMQTQSLLQVLQDVVHRCHRGAPALHVALNVENGFPAAVPAMVKVELASLLQESLTNVRRHAAARHVTVTLGTRGQDVWMDVADDGQGFSLQAPRDGVGLATMRERAQALGGTLQVHSTIGHGTVVRFYGARSALLQTGTGLRLHRDISDPVIF